jgi:uncharacterized protein
VFSSLMANETPNNASAEQIIEHFKLIPHPEGGYYRETFRDERTTNRRAASTAIYFLLAAGQRSHWHRVDATEVWHWYSGDALVLQVWKEGGQFHQVRLGMNLAFGEQPQVVVNAGVWQSAEPLGRWTLAGCTVAPGFEFTGFELAPTGWNPLE